MALFKKTDNFLGRYDKIVPITRFLAPIFHALYYLCAVLFLLTVIVSFIVMLVKVEVREMLLPPHMQEVFQDDVLTSYTLKLGNGLKITANAQDITLSHIKLVIYSKLVALALSLLIITPVFKLISELFRNTSNGNVLSESNAKYINLTGLIIIVGNTLYTIIGNVFNYLQVEKFMAKTNEIIDYSFDLEWYGIIIGTFIIIIGTIYGYACSLSHTQALTKVEGD